MSLASTSSRTRSSARSTCSLHTRHFRREMGGRPRRGLLFDGAPGTGKTYTAKALAAEANVPFLFATATSFQSSMQGATQRKIRSYFKALREGGPQGRRRDRVHRRVRRDRWIACGRCRMRRRSRSRSTACRCRCGGLEGLADVGVAREAADAVRGRRRPGDGGQRAAGADAVLRRADRPASGSSASSSTPPTCCCRRTAS